MLQYEKVTADEALGGHSVRVKMSRGLFVSGCIIKAQFKATSKPNKK
jgi:hypothetical protein